MPLASDQVLVALDRILTSDSFRHAGQSRAFLAYVVTETVAGRGARLSERTVGRGALDRGPRFDGRTDASVRVRASRVRRALEHYYRHEGASDVVRIELPLGSYVPSVTWTTALEPPTGSVKHGVMVLPFVASGPTATALAELAVDSLVRHLQEWSIDLVSGPDSAGPSRASTAEPPLSHRVSGSVVALERSVRSTARVIDTRSGQILWSTSSDIDLSGDGALGAVDTWGAAVAAALLDHTGALIRSWARHPGASAPASLKARVAWFRYLEHPMPERVDAAVSDVDDALAAVGREPHLLAIRAALSAARVLQSYADDEAKELVVAEGLARESLLLDPYGAHAHFVLAGVARARGEWLLVREHARTAAEAAPLSPSSQFTSGALVAASGQWRSGVERMTAALQQDPGLPANVHVWLAIGHCVLTDYARSLVECSFLGADAEPFASLCRTVALSGLGYGSRAREEATRVLELRADLDRSALRGLLTRYVLIPDQDLDRLVACFVEALPPEVRAGVEWDSPSRTGAAGQSW